MDKTFMYNIIIVRKSFNHSAETQTINYLTKGINFPY